VAFVATTGIILGAAYMLYLYRRVIYGQAPNAEVSAMPDLSARELAIMIPLGLSVLWMGVYPESFLRPMRRDVGSLLARLAPANPGGDSKLQFGHIAPPAAHEGAH
jgi:NADH-quinone oxidoreductase subunit M